ncbi:MAG: AAA family ATPase [Bacteroidetes bacterium]|nr:AAA family ATPase [Bacteroidota bacterium]
MIKSIQIKNFKSVVDLSLEIGSFNVLIGENGCGKSNILEAIGFGAAASADKLDFEFLGSRGIRLTNPDFMFSAFSNGKKKSINIRIKEDKEDYFFDLRNDQLNSKKWRDYFKEELNNINEKMITVLKESGLLIKSKNHKELNYSDDVVKLDAALAASIKKLLDDFQNKKHSSSNAIANYIIYSPEQSSLRRFEDTTQIYPIGIRGEGIFQYLKELAFDKKNKKILDEIKESLMLLDWYEDFDMPDNLMQNEYSLKIKDKYLYEKLSYFDQRSTNEGFLFLLFYATLFISKDTPAFFAIDNIDASFNPKLCRQLIKTLAALAKKHKKQVIVTTHNPAILDGLDLQDDGQRLFVVSRNDEGHTRAERINYNAKRTMNLSEVWTKGFIGGLPDNF